MEYIISPACNRIRVNSRCYFIAMEYVVNPAPGHSCKFIPLDKLKNYFVPIGKIYIPLYQQITFYNNRQIARYFFKPIMY